MLLEVLFICLEHTIEPRETLLGAVVAVQDNWTVETDQSTRHFVKKKPDIHTVSLGQVLDVQRGRDGSKDGCLLLVIGKPLAHKVGASALRFLEDDRSLDIPLAYINTPLLPLINEKR